MYYGAIKAEIFDINRFTYYISYLKIAAIKGLDYEEFLKFMMPLRNGEKTKEFWNLKVLKKILGIMPKDVAYFWERAFYVFTKYGLGNFTFLTDKSTNELSITMGMPFYAREEEYYKLKNILKETDYPKFYLSRLSNLSSVVKDCYDIVYLSNIIECMVYETLSSYPYFYPVNENNVELEKINIVGEQVLQMLKKDGIILMSYRANTSLENSPDILYNNDFFEATLVPAKIDASNRNDNRNADTDIVLTYCPSTKGNFLG